MRTSFIQLADGTLVLNANFLSTPLPINQLAGWAVQVVVTGTPTGTFKLQSSCDQDFGTPSNWTDITSSIQGISAAGDITWNAREGNYNWVRLVYIDGSDGGSTATLLATFNGKEL